MTGTTMERLFRENQELRKVLRRIHDAFKDVRDCNPMFADLLTDDAREAATDAAVDSALAFQDRPTAAQIVGDRELVELLERVNVLLQLSTLVMQVLVFEEIRNALAQLLTSSDLAVVIAWIERFSEDGNDVFVTMAKLQSVLARLTEKKE